jgi:sortase A
MNTETTAVIPIAPGKTKKTHRWIERGLMALAVILLGRWGAVTLAEHHYQEMAARRLEAADLARMDVPGSDAGHGQAARTRAEMHRSGLVGRLVIPRAGVSVAVAEGTDARTLDRAVGHLRSTAVPGEGGHIALAGHRDTFFRRLGRLRPGDSVRLRTPDGTFTYRVIRSEIVPPERTDVIQQAPLALITCYPFHWIGPAPKRFVVLAEPLGATPSRRRS